LARSSIAPQAKNPADKESKLRVRGALIAIKISSCEVSFLEKRQDELVSCHSDVATPVRFTAEWITLSDVP